MDFRSFTRWFSWMHLQEAGEQTVLDQSPALQVVDAFFPWSWGPCSSTNGRRAGGALRAPHKEGSDRPNRKSQALFFSNALQQSFKQLPLIC